MKSTKLFTFVTLLSVLLGFFPIQISSAMDGYWGIESPVKMSSSPYLPTISIQKQVAVDGEMTWYDADMPEGPVVVAGNEFVWFRFLVTNESEIPLSDISLYDTGFDNAIANQCNIPDTMDPYASFVCTIGPFETIVGQHENTAVVVGYADMCATQQGEDCIIEVSDENQAYYLGIIQPEASFEKFINDVPADALSDALEVDAGTLLVFKYEVTNIGVSPLIWTELTDDVFGVLTEECGDFPRAIPAGESDSCEISRVAEDAPNGVQNIGYATIMDLGELTDPAWYLTVELPEPGYSFEKFINGMAADTLVEAVQVQAGDTLAFSYEITNTGNVSLTWADLTDDVFGNLVGECSGFPRVVEAGAQDSCVIT
ncbi:MAG: hypothetical protein JXA33_13495, partial [Anaerolineae bacterium]|nr:hypothetical protein [Anaerolineae bacterium]